jgi:3-hydroxyisobutyrate dehydrogenase-like beta-hydroxyacid dehydrogenase
MEISVVGLGAIGSLLAMHLLNANHDVIVWNRSADPVRRLAVDGARPAATMADAFQADAVISVLFDDAAVRERLLDDALLSGARPGLLHICMSTISPALSAELDAACRRHGLRYVAAPVFGRPDAAARAELQVLVAGERDAVRQAHEILGVFGQTWSMGEEPPHAHLAKLAGNFMMGCAIEAMAECSGLLSACGADHAAFLDIMARTLFASPIHESFAPSVAGVTPLPASGLDIPLKDMDLWLAAARQSDVELAFIGALLERLSTARAAGFGADDWSAALGKLARKTRS